MSRYESFASIMIMLGLVLAIVFVVAVFLLLQSPGVRGATPALDESLPSVEMN
jgi:hypothetical protein